MNYVDRPTKDEKNINNDELSEGKKRLEEIVKDYKPRVVCFVGKKCCKYQLYIPRTKNDIEFGLQTRKVNETAVLCIPQGSTKWAQIKFEDKLK